jgi:hypothetical protein
LSGRFNAEDFLALISFKGGEKKATSQEEAQKLMGKPGPQRIKELSWSRRLGGMLVPPIPFPHSRPWTELQSGFDLSFIPSLSAANLSVAPPWGLREN